LEPVAAGGAGLHFGAATDDRHVKHLIRNPRSKQYFNHGQWTAKVKEAQSFLSAEAALAVALQCALNNVELVLQLGVEPSEADDIYSAAFSERVEARLEPYG